MKINTDFVRTLASAVPAAAVGILIFFVVFSFPWSMGSESTRMLAPWFTTLPAIALGGLSFLFVGNIIKGLLTPTENQNANQVRTYIVLFLLVGVPAIWYLYEILKK